MIERVYHPYDLWEDYQQGMYEMTCFMDEQKLIADCEQTLKCPEWLMECMLFVSHNWSFAAEHHLTNTHRNRQAWLGQSACCWIHGAPEYTTKKAWNNLTEHQKTKANAVADEVIQNWEEKYIKGYFQWQK